MFHSLATQIPGKGHSQIRKEVCDWLSAPGRTLHDLAVADWLVGHRYPNVAAYVAHMRRNGVWGGGIELAAASQIYGRTIRVFDKLPNEQTGRNAKIAEFLCQQGKGRQPIRLIYLNRCHYSGLRPI